MLTEILPDHMDSVNTIKARVDDLMKTEDHNIDPADLAELRDVDVLRFLKARQFDIDVAYELLITSLRWRKENKIRAIVYKDVHDEIIKNKVLIPGYDKQRRLICYVLVKLHFPGSSDKKKMQDLVLYMMEKCRHKIDPVAETFNLVFDLSDFSLYNMDYDLVRYLIKIFSDYYPETLGVSLVVNSPWLFKGCWQIVKPWMDTNTTNKVVFVTNDQLRGYIDEEFIPKEVGGGCDVKTYGIELTEDELASVENA